MEKTKSIRTMVEECVKKHEDLNAVTRMIARAKEKQKKPAFHCFCCSEWFVETKRRMSVIKYGCPIKQNAYTRCPKCRYFIILYKGKFDTAKVHIFRCFSATTFIMELNLLNIHFRHDVSLAFDGEESGIDV